VLFFAAAASHKLGKVSLARVSEININLLCQCISVIATRTTVGQSRGQKVVTFTSLSSAGRKGWPQHVRKYSENYSNYFHIFWGFPLVLIRKSLDNCGLISPVFGLSIPIPFSFPVCGRCGFWVPDSCHREEQSTALRRKLMLGNGKWVGQVTCQMPHVSWNPCRVTC